MRGSIRQKGPDLWELRIYLGLDPVTGKDRSLSRTFHGGRRAADKELACLVTEHGGGAPWFPNRITLEWIRLRSRHGLDGVKLHALRHLAVSAMLDAGIPVRDVADMVGHLDTRTTSIYTHGNEERRREAAMVMDELVASE